MSPRLIQRWRDRRRQNRRDRETAMLANIDAVLAAAEQNLDPRRD